MHVLHASAVAFDGRALLITGKSGSGKSSLAIELIAIGGTLVADDRVVLTSQEDGLWLDVPEPLRNRVEARGIGILSCPTKPAFATAIVDLDHVETARMPEPHSTVLQGFELPVLRKVESPAFAAMLRLYLIEGLSA